MINIKKIKQACFLACIESFLKDNNININQECMISVLSNLGLCSRDGIVSKSDVYAVGKIFNILVSDIPWQWPINELHLGGALFICTNEISGHCVRFLKQEEEEKVIVMDPEDGGYKYYDRSLLEQMKAQCFKIELQAPRV